MGEVHRVLRSVLHKKTRKLDTAFSPLSKGLSGMANTMGQTPDQNANDLLVNLSTYTQKGRSLNRALSALGP